MNDIGASVLTSRRHHVDDYEAAIDYAYRAGWTDGLPIVPPTERRVVEFLDAAGLAPTDTVVEIPERARVISAEKVAVNAVMAGCLPQYLPVIIAALEAMADPRYKFNHLASMGSPWPMMIVNGPVAAELEINNGRYLFGPGHRPNLTIARGLSLVLRNCAGARNEDTQRGAWGNPMRLVGCIAENEAVGWTPLHVQHGFQPNDSTVTVLSVYPGSPCHISINEAGNDPARLLNSVCHAMANWGGGMWIRGTYTLLMGPHFVDTFQRQGWTKQDIHDYLIENTKSSVASLKERQAWGKHLDHVSAEELVIQPGDHERYVHLFKKTPEYEPYVSWPATLETNYDRDIDVFVIPAGGDAGQRMTMTIPHSVSTNPVTKMIRPAR